MTKKSVMSLATSIKYMYVCLPVCLLNINMVNCDNVSVVDILICFIIAIFCSGYTNFSIFNKNKKTAAVLDSCVKYWLNYLKGTIETLSAQNYLATINQLIIIINTLFLASIREKRY